MNLENQIELLLQLSDKEGIGSDEAGVISLVTKYLKIEPQFDGLGSALYSLNQSLDKPSIMLATHCDEVGFMISKINDDGTCSITQIGNIWNHLVLNQDVYIKTNNGNKILGLIGSPITHGMKSNEKQNVVSNDKVFIDLGVASYEDAINLGIEIGNTVTFATKATRMNNGNFISGKALDNRVSVFVGCLVTEAIAKQGKCNFTLATSVQEEVGLRGARTIANLLEPDLCIVLDTTAAKTFIDDVDVELGKGVVINVIDSMTILNRGILNYLESLCDDNGIDYQLGLFTDGGTDSGNIHKSKKGIHTINIGIPIRYMHAQRSIVHTSDIESATKLILLILENMTHEKLKQISIENYRYRG